MREVLRTLWEGWKAIAARIGHWQTRIVLSLLYFVVMCPVALCVRFFVDPLELRPRRGDSRWRPRQYPTLSMEQAGRQ